MGKDEARFATKKELNCKVFVTCGHWLLSQAGAVLDPCRWGGSCVTVRARLWSGLSCLVPRWPGGTAGQAGMWVTGPWGLLKALSCSEQGKAPAAARSSAFCRRAWLAEGVRGAGVLDPHLTAAPKVRNLAKAGGLIAKRNMLVTTRGKGIFMVLF